MQNWNQWQLPATAVTTSISQPPIGYAAAATPGVDPMTLMQTYMQYYNQPTPTGYTPEQWAAAQQQGWAQWQQWQQQYQQWQAQYGDKYQETMKQLSAQGLNLAANQMQLPPQLPYVQPPPPLPKEDIVRPPPLPPVTVNTVYHQFANMPPPNQNNLPLFPAKETAKATAIPQANASNYLPPNQQPPPLPSTNQQQQRPLPLPPKIENKRSLPVIGQVEKCDNITINSSEADCSSAKKLKLEDDNELTEAERTFDAQFKQWEEQFNKWKQQNANHPDKTQYKQYEAKWTSWRGKLLERREQMRKKREQQKQPVGKAMVMTADTTAGADTNSNNNISSDDKIFNILSNTKNQRLINNVLGIGKTLGLTGKQNATTNTLSLPPPPPPPPTEMTISDNKAMQTLTQQNVMDSTVAPPPSWPNQQWGNNQQYNSRMETPDHGAPSSSLHHHPPFGHQVKMPNFAQPPPNLPSNSGPLFNFSQPPPNFSSNNNNGNQEQSTQNTARGSTNTQDHPPNVDMRFPQDRGSNFDRGQQSDFFRKGTEHQDRRFVAGRGDVNPGGNEPDQLIRSGDITFRQNDVFNDRLEAQQRFRRGDRSFSNEFGNNTPNNFPYGNDGRFGPSINERFSGGNNRFGPMGSDRFMVSNDRFVSNHDRLGLDRFGSGGGGGSGGGNGNGNERFAEADRFGRGVGNEHRFDRSDNERFGPNDRFDRSDNERFGSNDRFDRSDNERFGPNDRFDRSDNERFGPSDRFDRFADRPGFGSDSKDRFPLANEHFGSNERFAKGSKIADCFEPKDANEHRRDSLGSNPRGFGKNPSFSPSSELSPELKKLMEKRKAAGDVFKPSFLSDSERNNSVGSLSESFKKIAGESPFRSFDFPKNRAGGQSLAGNFPNNTSGSGPLSPHFQAQPSASDSAPSSYGYPSRGSGHTFNNNSNIRDSDSAGAFSPRFRQAPFLDNFMKHGGPIDYNERKIGKDTETRLQNINQENQLTSTQSQSPSKYHSENTGTSVNPDSPSKLQVDNVDAKDTEMMRQTNEISDSAIEQKNDPVKNNSLEKNDDNEEKSEVSGQDDISLQQQQDEEQDNSCEKMEKRKDNADNSDDSVQTKKPESLPFIGESDPQPEDLNIEPPPELPNLGPVLTNMNPSSENTAESFNKTLDDKTQPDSGVQFHDMRSQEMEFKIDVPFKSQEPPSMFNPKISHMFSPGLGALDSQSHADNPPLGLSEGQHGSNVPDNNGRLSPRRQLGPNEQFDGRDDSKTKSEHTRNSNSGQFGTDEQQSGQFSGPRGPGKFGQVGSRFPNEFQFPLRNTPSFRFRNNDAQFGLRGANEGACGIKGPNDTHSHHVARHSGDAAQFGFMGFNNNKFGRSNEVPLDKRPPSFDNNGPFNFLDGRSNEGVAGILPRGPLSDVFSPGRRSPKSFSESRFDSRNPNDRSFEHSDFKDKSLAAKNPMGDSNYTFDYMRRSGPYTRRGQFEDDMRQFENSMTGSDGPFDRDHFDRNPIDMEARKDNVEYARRTPTQDPFKKELENDIAPRLPPFGGLVNNAWARSKFNDDNRKNFDRNAVLPNVTQIEERSKPELMIGDFHPPGFGGDAELDRQLKFHSSNLFVKRSQSTRSSGGGHNNEFCVPRQYNYNHGEVTGGSGSSGGERKFVEYTPTKVIDYGHTSRPNVIDYYLPPTLQYFDYAHGDLKLAIPMDLNRDHHYHQRKEFRNWVENEQSIKDYTDKMRICYENPKKEYTEKLKGSFDNYERSGYEMHRSLDYNKQQRMKDNSVWQQQENDKKSCGEQERRDNEDPAERSSMYDPFEEQRLFFERDSNASDRHSDRSVRRERAQETCESSRRETNKDNDKDRSKGSINWQENSNKNIVDAKLQNISLSDTQKNVVESTTPRTLEMPKMPNYTMVDDLLCPPGRQSRPAKIAVILRGPPGSGKSFVAKLIKDKEVEQGGSAPRILSLDDYFLVEKEIETKDDNGKKVTVKEMVYEYEEAMEQSYITSLVKAFKKNITDGFFNFIILDCINEKISDYEEMWNFAKTKGFKVYVCEMEMDLQICLKRNIHNRTEDEINRIIDYFEPTPSYHLKLDVNSMLQEQAIEEVDMEDSQQETQDKTVPQNEDSQDSHEDAQDAIGVSKWEKMEAEDKLDRLDGLAKKKSETRPQTMEDFLQVPDYYNMEDIAGKKHVRWADLEERKEQEKMRAVGFVVGHTNWDRMMDPTKGGSALTRTKYI